jgi:hypothetical protein
MCVALCCSSSLQVLSLQVPACMLMQRVSIWVHEGRRLPKLLHAPWPHVDSCTICAGCLLLPNACPLHYVLSTCVPSHLLGLMHAVCRYGDSAALARLLQRGCPVDAADYDGRTLLHVAVTNKQQVGLQPDYKFICRV